jgi:hypothetical protein
LLLTILPVRTSSPVQMISMFIRLYPRTPRSMIAAPMGSGGDFR